MRIFLLILFSVTLLFPQRTRFETNTEELVAVGVNGAKVTPGTYRVSPDQRVLDVIKMANGGKLPPLDTIDCRNIVVTNPSGKSDTFDILRFLNTGDLSQNPYVSGGQSIRIGFATEWVFLSGDIQGVLMGNIPLKKKETAAELLSLYTPNATADLDAILIERMNEPSKEYSFRALDQQSLKNLDAITIFPVKERKDVQRVLITGEVKRPGIYSIVHGETSARSLIEKSGGSTEWGDLSEAWVVRKGKKKLIPGKELSSGMESVKKEITYSVSNSIKSGDFLILPLRDEDSKLEDGDEIVVPRKENLVYVSGKVKNPGGYLYTPGKDVNHYIAAAGGISSGANRRELTVVETFGDVYRTVEREKLTAGDIIFMPEKDKERQTRFVLGVITSIASVATSLITVVAFTQNQINN